MKELVLNRIYKDNVTLGILFSDHLPYLRTLELPWLDNKKQVSCIPEGEYICVPYDSPTKGKVFLLKDVKNRSMIEIHIGNTTKDIQGCILVGTDFGEVKGLPAVINSKRAMESLRGKMDNQPFKLIIK